MDNKEELAKLVTLEMVRCIFIDIAILSVCLSVCLSVYLSVCLSVHLSVCLSVHPFVRDVPILDENGLTYCHSIFTIR